MKRPPGTTWIYWMEGDWVHVKVTREGQSDPALAHVLRCNNVSEAEETCLQLLSYQGVSA